MNFQYQMTERTLQRNNGRTCYHLKKYESLNKHVYDRENTYIEESKNLSF